MKLQIGTVPFFPAIPIALVGSLVEGRPNFETVGDCGIMGLRPPLVYVSSGVAHYTNGGILANGAFSINLPSASMLEKVDFCAQVSGKDVDKSVLFTVFYGVMKSVPLIDECPINLECKVVKEFTIETRQIFIGEIIQAHVSAQYTTTVGGRPTVTDAAKVDPVLYGMDNHYYRLGESIGSGYRQADALLERFGVRRSPH